MSGPGPNGLSRADLANEPRDVAVYVCATLQDTRAERSALLADVYPYLRSLCRVLGLTFSWIDMRWGVSGEDNAAVSVDDPRMTGTCLASIGRCLSRRVSPSAPYFLALLGNRYGDRPPVWEVPKAEFEKLLKFVAGWQRALLESWYKLDTNPAEAVFALQPCPGDVAPAWWREVGRPLQDALVRASEMAKLSKDISPERAEEYRMSLNEIEITRGITEPFRAAGGTAPQEGALVIRRRITRIPRSEKAGELLGSYIDSGDNADAIAEVKGIGPALATTIVERIGS